MRPWPTRHRGSASGCYGYVSGRRGRLRGLLLATRLSNTTYSVTAQLRRMLSCSSFTHSFVRSCIFSLVLSFIHPSIHQSIHPYIHKYIHPASHLFIHSSIHPFMYSFVHLFINSHCADACDVASQLVCTFADI